MTPKARDLIDFDQTLDHLMQRFGWSRAQAERELRKAMARGEVPTYDLLNDGFIRQWDKAESILGPVEELVGDIRFYFTPSAKFRRGTVMLLTPKGPDGEAGAYLFDARKNHWPDAVITTVVAKTRADLKRVVAYVREHGLVSTPKRLCD
jgi:hypothetical protein